MRGYLSIHVSRNVRPDVGKIRRFAPMALAGSMLLAGISCGALTPSGGQGAATGSTVGRGTGKTVSGQPAYAAALQTEIESVMKANVVPGAIVLIKSRDKDDWQTTFGTGEIGRTASTSASTRRSTRIRRRHGHRTSS